MHGCIGQNGRRALQLRLAIIAFAVGFFFGALVPFLPLIGGILLVIFVIAYFFAAIIWLPGWCKATCFHATSDAIMLERGLIWRKTIFLTRSKIRYTTLTATPLQRMFGVVSLYLMTAGGKVVLPHIARSEANQLADLMRLSLPR